MVEDEVLVKMVASGVCHTDIGVAKGLLPASFPAILGKIRYYVRIG